MSRAFDSRLPRAGMKDTMPWPGSDKKPVFATWESAIQITRGGPTETAEFGSGWYPWLPVVSLCSSPAAI